MTERRGKWKRPGTLWSRIRARYRVNKKTGCHEWTALCTPSGYARMWWAGRDNRVTRLLWATKKGPIPVGLNVLHRCDNRACIRLKHLFLGTDLDNARDRDRKGRHAHGETSGTAVLTATRVRHIRAARNTPLRVFAAKFKVSISAVGRARQGVTWSHL